MNKQLSPVMKACRDYMREHGGKIRRHQGGFWADENWKRHLGGVTFGTSTVEALVSRGVAEYSVWKEGRNGRFPIEARL